MPGDLVRLESKRYTEMSTRPQKCMNVYRNVEPHHREHGDFNYKPQHIRKYLSMQELWKGSEEALIRYTCDQSCLREAQADC